MASITIRHHVGRGGERRAHGGARAALSLVLLGAALALVPAAAATHPVHPPAKATLERDGVTVEVEFDGPTGRVHEERSVLLPESTPERDVIVGALDAARNGAAGFAGLAMRALRGGLGQAVETLERILP